MDKNVAFKRTHLHENTSLKQYVGKNYILLEKDVR